MSDIARMDIKDIIHRAGGPSKLAKKLGLSHSTVIEWTRVPFRHVAAVASLLKVERREICDLWDEPGPSEKPEPVHGEAA